MIHFFFRWLPGAKKIHLPPPSERPKDFTSSPPVFARGDIFFLTLPEVNLVGWFTNKTTTPKQEKHEKHRNIQTKHQLLGVPAVDSGGFWSPQRGGSPSSYLRIARAEDLVAGAGRVAKGAVKDTVGESPETNHTDVGKAWVWGWFLGLCWGFLGILIGGVGCWFLDSSRLVVGVQRF